MGPFKGRVPGTGWTCIVQSPTSPRLESRLEFDGFTGDFSGLVSAVDDAPGRGVLVHAGGAGLGQMPRQSVAPARSIPGKPAFLHPLHHDLCGDIRGQGKIEIAHQTSAKVQLAIRLFVIPLPGELHVAAPIKGVIAQVVAAPVLAEQKASRTGCMV